MSNVKKYKRVKKTKRKDGMANDIVEDIVYYTLTELIFNIIVQVFLFIPRLILSLFRIFIN